MKQAIAGLAIAALVGIPFAVSSTSVPSTSFTDTADWLTVLANDFCTRHPEHPKCPTAPTVAPSPTVVPSVTPSPITSTSPIPTPTASPSAAPTPSATSSPSPTGTGPWGNPTAAFPNLLFADDFTTLDTSRYSFYPTTWTDTSKHGHYAGPACLTASGGLATITLLVDGSGPHSCAFIPQLSGGADHLYLRVAERFCTPVRTAGWKDAWLLWPKSGVWPRDGEIDFPEGNLTGTISAFMHRQNATSGSDQDAYSTGATFASCHTAVTEWGPTQTRFLLDGAVIGTSTSRIPNTPMHLVVQSETVLDGTIPTQTAKTTLDWIAVWGQ